jgi:hypothetical protein
VEFGRWFTLAPRIGPTTERGISRSCDVQLPERRAYLTSHGLRRHRALAIDRPAPAGPFRQCILALPRRGLDGSARGDVGGGLSANVARLSFIDDMIFASGFE